MTKGEAIKKVFGDMSIHLEANPKEEADEGFIRDLIKIRQWIEEKQNARNDSI